MIQSDDPPTKQLTKHEEIVLEEEQLESPESAAYYYCIPFIQERVHNDMVNCNDGTEFMYYVPLLYCCISKQLLQGGIDNVFTTVFLPYCLDSLRYKMTREKHKIYCIWETFVNINFILCYLMFFSTYIFVMACAMIGGSLICIGMSPISVFFENPYTESYCMPFTWFAKKCKENHKYVILVIPLILVVIVVVIVLIILGIISFVFLVVLGIGLILVAIVVELVLLVLFVIAFIVWNILFCCYPISCIIYRCCVGT